MAIDSTRLHELKNIAARVLRESGFEPDFSAQALQQAESAAGAVAAASEVRDLRALLWCSIDNDDSRDLDQLTVAEAPANGAVKVLVAIADVDSLVVRGTPLDDHAANNTTSIYTAAGIYPMLPEKLSTDLTSLVEGEQRLAIVIEVTVLDDGTVGPSDIYRAWVLNRAKLAYGSVAAWLDGNAPAPPRLAAVKGLDEQLRVQDRAAQLLRRTRHERGALSLETSQARAVFSDGVLSDLRDEQKNRAQELVEDLMIAANGVTARYLTEKHFPSLRRALRAPERWDRIVTLAAQRGGQLPSAPDARALDAFLLAQREAHPETFAELSLSVVKLLGSGEYTLEMPGEPAAGHFGLAARDYTHSTAPNRRFPDLLTQRLLKAAMRGTAPPYSVQDLSALASHCSEQEKKASKVERQINKCAAGLLLAARVGESFDGIVTGASDKGTWVRIAHPAAEGKIVRGFAGLDVGDRVRVKLEHVDSARGFIDFAYAAR
jgi:VacB/RNase II family 3'-5' exoribonuclease